MPSEVDICNMAFLGIGAEPKIASFFEDSQNARLARQFYQPVVDAVIRSHLWNCAKFYPPSSLTPLSTQPDTPDYTYQYQLPVNPYCLRLIRVGNRDDQPTRWEVVGRTFLYDESSAKVVYNKRITDPTEFDPLLVDAIVNRLQIKFAMPLSKTMGLVQGLIEEYETITAPIARTIDAQENSHLNQQMITEDWNTARW